MKHIFQIYRNDWVRIFKVPMALFLVVGLMILPSLYAWFNIKASWDPYSNTKDIEIAVVNKDEGTFIHKGKINKKIDVGEEVVKSLKENKDLGWKFVSEKEAQRGVRHGDYYASLVIPKDFSKKIGTVLEENPQKPQIYYSVNEKINAVAPKITSKGASNVTEQVSEKFVKTATKSMFEEFNRIGIELEQELPTIRNFENRVFVLEEKLPEIEDMGNKALEIEQKLPEIREQGQKVVELEEKLPEIQAAGQSVLKIEKELPKVKEAGNEIIELQKKLPEIKSAGDRVVEIDQNFYKIEEGLNKALEDAKKANEIVTKAQSTLPTIENIANKGSEFAQGLNEFLEKNEGAFNEVAPVIKQNLVLLNQTAKDVAGVTEELKNVNDENRATYIETLSALETRLSSGIDAADRTVDLLTKLNEYTGNNALAGVINRVNNVKDSFTNQREAVVNIENALKRGEQPSSEALDRLNTLATDANNTLSNVLTNYDSSIVPAVNSGLDKLTENAKNANNAVQTAKEKLPDIKGVLNDASSGLQYGQQELTSLQERLPTIRDRIHEAATTISSKMDDFTNAVNSGAAFVQNDLPAVEAQIHKAADFVNNDLPEAEKEIQKAADLVQTKLPEVEETVHKVANLVRDDLPDLEDSVKNAADKIRDFEGENDLGDIIELLKNDVQKESDFFTSPVQLKEDKQFPIPNYGSAMTPFYTALCLWVGGLLLISLLRVDVEDVQEGTKGMHIYFGRLLTFLTIGFFQALIVTLGDLFILGSYVAEPTAFVLSAIFISMVFLTIIYTFVSVFGNIGKAFAIILLVLQISGSGGTFPIQTTPPFFQAINPFLPFTYAIGLLRETTGGIVRDIMIHDILLLALFLFIAILLAFLLKKPLSGWAVNVAKKAKESKIIH
ncbi:YhgE/Pip domain-containing protein [Priestia filamentosa]|uniref:YhgE/Pip domain-containing protein n=1 Tax=Priestia filamentosa TaxID=1402861 RepID=UPI00397E7576